MTSRKHVSDLVLKYQGLRSDYQDINALIDIRRKISTHLYLMATEMGEKRKEWKISEIRNEIKITQTALMQRAGTALKNNAIRANMETELTNAAKLEGDFNLMAFEIKQANEVLGTLNQHIATLRAERENTKRD